MHSMLHSYCKQLGLSYLDVPTTISATGENVVNLTEESGARLFSGEGYGYWGWRNYARCLNRVDFSRTRNIFLVRDPRDRLVSQFFSFGRSHAIPESGKGRQIALESRREAAAMNIDEYALSKISWIDLHWRLYHEHLDPATTRLYRYEDVIFKKEEWLTDIVQFFDFPYAADVVRTIATVHDVLPTDEDPDAHIRQVKPGNHKAHLSASTIESLDRELNAYLRAYGYFQPEEYGRRLVFAQQGADATRAFMACR